jgi:8-oxo-dGTP pyrophosphatase MutT (NUDIX family)
MPEATLFDLCETMSRKRSARSNLQYAALPYRSGEGADREVLLVTSRKTRRWIIPKGWPLEGKPPHATAAREALEEAGLVGTVTKQPIGSYSYVKRAKGGDAIECEVHVFPMEVTAQKRRWQERGEREMQWFSIADAAAAVDDPALANLIRSFERTDTRS